MSLARTWLTRAPALLVAAALLGACSTTSTPRTTEEGANEQEAAILNVRLGVAYLQQGNLAIAKEKLERALKQNPRDPNVHAALALLYERLGSPAQVDAHFNTAMRLAPRDPDISNNYAVYLCKAGRHAEGVKRFERAARNALYRTPEAAYTNAGVCLRRAGRAKEAEEYFRRALEKRPNYAEAAVQLGDLYLEQGRTTEARARIDHYLGEFAPTPDLLLLGVRVSRTLGDRLAEQRYARRLRLDFPDSDAARALAELTRNPG
jgi:type IV pilus assembly protein PilF